MDLQSTLKNVETSEPTSMTNEFTQFRAQTEYQILQLQRLIQENGNDGVMKERLKTHVEDLEMLKTQIKTMEKSLAQLREYLLQTDGRNRIALGNETDSKLESFAGKYNETMEHLSFGAFVGQISKTGADLHRSSSSANVAGDENLICETPSLERQLGISDIKNPEIDPKFQVPETLSLLRRICDFQRRKADARNGKALSLYSQPFYTSRGGYKMGSSIYLNGDGTGLQRSHSIRIHEIGPLADLTAPPPGASCYNQSYGSPRPRTRRSSSSDDDDEALYGGPTPGAPRLNLAYEGLKRRIIAMFGDVKDPQKRAMLKLGLSKLGNLLQTMQDAIDDFVLRASNFLNMPLGDVGGLPRDDLFEAIIRSIPNDKWMRFVRCELNLSEPEIRKIKETCEPTEEQLIQLENMIQEIHGAH